MNFLVEKREIERAFSRAENQRAIWEVKTLADLYFLRESIITSIEVLKGRTGVTSARVRLLNLTKYIMERENMISTSEKLRSAKESV